MPWGRVLSGYACHDASVLCCIVCGLAGRSYSHASNCMLTHPSDSLMLLLYEDMMADMELAQKQIALHLRVGAWDHM